MASITVTFDDAIADRVYKALCAEGPRPADSEIPEDEYAQQYVAAWMERVTHAYEARSAGQAAAQDAADIAKDEIAII